MCYILFYSSAITDVSLYLQVPEEDEDVPTLIKVIKYPAPPRL